MSEHLDPVQEALRKLRGEIRDAVTPPPAAGLRARATRQLRVRRAAAVAVAAAVVAAVALSGSTLLGPDAAPPLPPAGTASPSLSPLPPPSLPPSPPTSPSPPDPITRVEWETATIDVPPRENCPDGPVEFVPFSDAGPTGSARGPRDGYPAVAFDATKVAYGDLDGDGRAEAVLDASCASSEEGLLGGHGSRLLVIARAEDGTLSGLGWAGPAGAAFLDWWISEGRLLVDADPWTAGPEEHFVPVPGLALAYEWDGDGFTSWEPAPEYPPIVPLADQPGPPVRLGVVATGLGCPDAELRFVRADYNGGTATAAGATWHIPETFFHQQFLFDLTGSGDRLLVIALECERPDGSAPQGLAVFQRGGEGWRGVSVLVHPEDGYAPSTWSTPAGNRFYVSWFRTGSIDPSGPTPYRWNGAAFEPIDR
jgi:hypothetical protein